MVTLTICFESPNLSTIVGITRKIRLILKWMLLSVLSVTLKNVSEIQLYHLLLKINRTTLDPEQKNDMRFKVKKYFTVTRKVIKFISIIFTITQSYKQFNSS